MDQDAAESLSKQKFVANVRLRPYSDKLELALRSNSSGNPPSPSGEATPTALFATLATPLGSAPPDADRIAAALAAGLRRHLGTAAASVRAAAPHKLEVEAPAPRLRAAAAWLAARPEVAWVERRPHFAARNRPSGKLLLSGPSNDVKESPSFDTTQFKLDGEGQAPPHSPPCPYHAPPAPLSLTNRHPAITPPSPPPGRRLAAAARPTPLPPTPAARPAPAPALATRRACLGRGADNQPLLRRPWRRRGGGGGR